MKKKKNKLEKILEEGRHYSGGTAIRDDLLLLTAIAESRGMKVEPDYDIDYIKVRTAIGDFYLEKGPYEWLDKYHRPQKSGRGVRIFGLDKSGRLTNIPYASRFAKELGGKITEVYLYRDGPFESYINTRFGVYVDSLEIRNIAKKVIEIARKK